MASAIRQQAITWASVDPDLCHHLVPLGHDELIGVIALVLQDIHHNIVKSPQSGVTLCFQRVSAAAPASAAATATTFASQTHFKSVWAKP